MTEPLKLTIVTDRITRLRARQDQLTEARLALRPATPAPAGEPVTAVTVEK